MNGINCQNTFFRTTRSLKDEVPPHLCMCQSESTCRPFHWLRAASAVDVQCSIDQYAAFTALDRAAQLQHAIQRVPSPPSASDQEQLGLPMGNFCRHSHRESGSLLANTLRAWLARVYWSIAHSANSAQLDAGFSGSGQGGYLSLFSA